jgi:hypothetical protein
LEAEVKLRAVLWAVLLTTAGETACEKEPTIVIKFEPQDLAGRDGGAVAAAAAVVVDAGARVVVADGGSSQAAGALCKTSADCFVVTADCCDCNHGGSLVAVGKAEHDAAKKRKCGGVMCAEMMSNDPSCGGHAECVSGHCALSLAKSPSVEKPAKKPAPAKK